MSLKTKTLPFLTMLVLALMTAGSYTVSEQGASAMIQKATLLETASPAPEGEQKTTDAERPEVEESERAEDGAAESPSDEEADPSADQANRWADYDNVCETFTVLEGEKLVKNKRGDRVYPVRYRRNRYDRKRSHQRRTRELIALVAQEMGADEEGQILLDMMAHHESSWNPEAIHILNGDLEANHGAWERHSYSAAKEAALLEKLERASALKGKFWDIKRELADLRMYKGNDFWTAQLEYTRQIPERTIRGEVVPAQDSVEYRSVWAFGYGLFGMNAVLYTHVLAKDAPPWVLCSDEGIEAVITAIWALREQQSTCMYLSRNEPGKYGTDGGSVRSVVRRWGSGMCRRGMPRGKAWHRLMDSAVADMAKRGKSFSWETVPDFGSKFPRYEMVKRRGKWRYKKDAKGRRIRTDPQVVIAHMRAKAEEKGILRPEPLKRKKPDTAPVIVALR